MVLTNKQKYNKKYKFKPNSSHSLNAISKKTGVDRKIIQEVYNRGTGAWKGNIASVRVAATGKKDAKAPRRVKMTKQQWSVARVYSFVMGGTTQKTADADLWKRHLKNIKKK